ncbi:MAG: aminotransferase class I/II-fold pyridoxal phosphate-dependent enzyme [Alphaproteobacteria bacterium]|nr:aminotransferase class I/II-fold pyridoxal phosphate-dependent enzyme [Alphaproteobacteria bacterium]
MGINVNRRFLLGGAVGGAGALAGCATAPASAALPADSNLPAGLFGPAPGVALLSRNENPYGPSPKVMAAVAEATRCGAYYCDTSYLAAMIAEKNGIAPSQVVLSTGSGEALSAAALAFGKSGAIACPALFWDTTSKYAEAKGVTLKRSPMIGDLEIDLAAIEASVDDSVSMVHICNPNNPTGRSLDPAQLRAFCSRVSEKVPVLVDEAYNELTDDPAGNSMMDLVRAGKNVLVARTFSKIYGMAGMRIGYIMASEEHARMISQYVMSWMSAPSLAAAVASYNDDAFLAFSKSKVTEARQMVHAAMTANGINYLPSETNFIYANVPDAAAYQRAMAARNIQIRGPYGALTQWSRVSMGKIEDVERYCAAIPEALGA